MNSTQETKQQESANHPGGRPTVMTPEVVGKLEEAFAIDASVSEACFYADISRDAFYDYVKKNPEFSDRVEALRQKPILKARQTIVKSLDNPDDARWYLERKVKNEFANRTEITGSQGKELLELSDYDKAKLDAIVWGFQYDPSMTAEQIQAGVDAIKKLRGANIKTNHEHEQLGGKQYDADLPANG